VKRGETELFPALYSFQPHSDHHHFGVRFTRQAGRNFDVSVTRHVRIVFFPPLPLLADSQNLHGHHKLHWTLRFPLPALSQAGNIRRFSAAPQRYGPRGHQALAGAIRCAAPFNYSAIENTVLQDVPFLRLPDIVQFFGSVRATGHSLHILARFRTGSAPELPGSLITQI